MKFMGFIGLVRNFVIRYLPSRHSYEEVELTGHAKVKSEADFLDELVELVKWIYCGITEEL